MRHVLLAATLLTVAAPALADQDCQDQFNECQDDCSMQHGSSVKDEAKRAFQKCLSKCVKKSNLCREQAMEVKSNDLDERALEKDNSAAAQELDENGYAKKGVGLRGKAVKGKDDVREEDPPGFFDDPGDGDSPKKKKKKKKARPEVREEEVVKSSRTSFGDEPETKPSAKAKEEPPPAKADTSGKKGKAPEEARAEPRPEPRPEPKAEAKPEPPPPAKESRPAAKASSDDDEDEKPKKSSKAKEPPPKKEEDDDLRNF